MSHSYRQLFPLSLEISIALLHYAAVDAGCMGRRSTMAGSWMERDESPGRYHILLLNVYAPHQMIVSPHVRRAVRYVDERERSGQEMIGVLGDVLAEINTQIISD
ncbi:hypothetical protein BOTBODRAFT_62372 [Botryobasidium botryosum FD-172 SS1]|uniref:Uncharacterized protein n=1 Tax=Botryobasidium botryosum (strain FD-172 SS1) TaxID=930990 RepID=A0A067MW78_BOTB1|nr:hypothetical protein BOTBODRAFT_62372 [Botryobasidium botryosum FD-172 SS1]